MFPESGMRTCVSSLRLGEGMGLLLHKVSTLLGSKNNVVFYPKQTPRNSFGLQTSADNAPCGKFQFLWVQTIVDDQKKLGQRHPPAGVDDQKTARPKARKPHKTDYKTDWQNTQNRQNRTLPETRRKDFF